MLRELWLAGICSVGLVAACAPAATPAPAASGRAAATAPPAAPTSASGGAPAAASPVAGAAVSAAPRAPVTVRIALLRSAADAGVYVGYEKGYFQAEGIELDFAQVDVGAQTIGFLSSGQLDVGGGGQSPALVNAVQRGVGVRAVVDKGNFSPGFGSTALLVRKDLADGGAIRDYADLRGRTVATPLVGSTAHMMVMKALEQGGLTHRDIDHVNLPFPDQPQALANRNIEIGATVEPFVTRAVEESIAVRWKGADEVYPSQQGALLFYGPQFMQTQPDAARGFMVAYLRGVRDYNDALRKGLGRDDLYAILAKHTAIRDVSLLARVSPTGLNPDGRVGVQTIVEDIERWIELGLLKPEDRIDPSALVDHQYVDYAVGRLGPYQY